MQRVLFDRFEMPIGLISVMELFQELSGLSLFVCWSVQMAPDTRDVSRVFRKPVRVSITISHAVFSDLVRMSMDQGRSVSNLAAYLLEAALGRPGL